MSIRLRGQSIRLVLATIFVSVFALGCLPSPNQPLGREPSDAASPSSANVANTDTASTTMENVPEIQPLITEQFSGSDGETTAVDPAILASSQPPPATYDQEGLPPLLPDSSAADKARPESRNVGESIVPLPEPSSNHAPASDLLSEEVTPIATQDMGIHPPPGTRPTIENPIDKIQIGAAMGETTTIQNDRTQAFPESVEMNAPLIPREQFFGQPERTMAKISPDGNSLAFLAASGGVMNVHVAPVEQLSDSRPVTNQGKLDIQDFYWAYTSRHILFLQDDDGDGDFHVFSANLDTGQVIDLTPLERASAKVVAVSHKFPAEILVGVDEQSEDELHDIHRVNIVTGEHEQVLENPGFRGFVVDDEYRIRFAYKYDDQGGKTYFQPGVTAAWEKYMEFASEDAPTSTFLGFDRTGEVLYFLDSRQANTGVLKSLDLTTGESQLLAENPLTDASGALVHPTEKVIQAVTFEHERRRWKILDPRIDADLDYLNSIADSDVNIISRTLDDSLWTVEFERDNGPVQYFLYDRDERATKFLFSERPALDDLPLVKMHPISITASDGLPLVSYLSLPPGSDPDGDGRPTMHLPMVLLVHGGPWDRDVWGYHPVHQLLANRGYAVLSVNYRGSTGFGKEFLNAGDGQWSKQIHGDLLDAVQFAVTQRISDPDYIAIMGGSFGGYATLVGLAFTPETFACGVDIVGPPNLVALMENPPQSWMPMLVAKRRVGDPDTNEGRADLLSRSPISRVNEIIRPLLIGHGGRDPFVRQEDSDHLVASLQHRNIPVTYLVCPDEGHGFQNPTNRLAFYAVTEAFLAKYLGGRSQPIGDLLQRAEVDVPVGANEISGLPR